MNFKSGLICIVLFMFILVAMTMGIVYINSVCGGLPPDVAEFPQSNLSVDNNNDHINISIYSTNLLNVVIALVVFIITCIAFVLPFTVLTTGEFQSAFFRTVIHLESLPNDIKNEIAKKYEIKKMSEGILHNARRLNTAYQLLIAFSLLALSALLATSFLYIKFNFVFLLYSLGIVFFVYLAFMFGYIIYIFYLLFNPNKKGAYPLLAEIQDNITEYILHNNGSKNVQQKVEKDVKDVNWNINLHLKIHDNSKKEER